VLRAALGALLAVVVVLAADDDAASAACGGSLLCPQPTSSGTARTAVVRVLVFVEYISFTSSVGEISVIANTSTLPGHICDCNQV